MTSVDSERVLLRMQGVCKRFGAVQALDGVDLTVRAGEVHALLGENGAGKSTLMKELSGALAPDAGSMTLDGEPYAPAAPQAALERGVAMIYQELNLAPHLTVEQNIMLGREQGRFGLVARRASRQRVRRALDMLGHPELSPGTRVGELGPGLRQLVEIARALVGEARVVVLDEPTSSLSAVDTEHLFEVIARLTQRGVAVVYISHFLEEVQRVAQRFTVLRDGRTVAGGAVAETPMADVIAAMIGRRLEEFFPRVPHEPGEVLLGVSDLAGVRLPHRASLELRRGEILGLAGLAGAGRTEFLRALFALDPVRSGEVRIAGVPAPARSPRERLTQGIGFSSEDRKRDGLLLDTSVAVNITLSRLQPFVRRGWIQGRARADAARSWVERLGIRCAGVDQPVGDLSGGNQQKVVLARLLHHDAQVLLLDEPTRGVDVASKVEIYRLLGELAARGKALLMVSSYLPELLGVCDRIAVMHRGVLGAARPVDDWTEHSLLEAAARGVA